MHPVWEVSAVKFNIFPHVQFSTQKVKCLHIGEKAFDYRFPTIAIQFPSAKINFWIIFGIGRERYSSQATMIISMQFKQHEATEATF